MAAFGDGEQKTPHLRLAVVSAGNNVHDVYDLSEETVIAAIENDINLFDGTFSGSFGNDPLTIHERMILKAYLWFRTKGYYRQYLEEQGGMVIDSNGTVKLTAADIVISSVLDDDERNRTYQSTITLSDRGQKDHDALVKAWLEWRRKYMMVIEGTKVICQEIELGSLRVTAERRLCGDIVVQNSVG